MYGRARLGRIGKDGATRYAIYYSHVSLKDGWLILFLEMEWERSTCYSTYTALTYISVMAPQDLHSDSNSECLDQPLTEDQLGIETT
jgi:hypothetical protein